MYYLYGSKPGVERRPVASFDSEQQLLSYVRWATLKENADGTFKFEQGSVLVGFTGYSYGGEPAAEGADPELPHNPSPSML